MRHLVLYATFLVLLALPIWSISFVEIHFDPLGDDKGQEFIELRMDAPIDLSGFILADAASNDTLFPIRVTNATLAVIVDDNFNISSLPDTASVYSAGARIGNGLGNLGDDIFLLDPNGTLVANTSYSGSIGGDGIPIIWINGTWAEGTPGGTPGWDDIVSENFSDITDEANASINDTNTTDAHNSTTTLPNSTSTPCAATFLVTVGEAATDDTIFSSGERIVFGFNFSDSIGEFRITYGVEDIFGDVRKAYRTTTSRAMKSYTPKTDARVDALVIKAALDAPCLDAPRRAEKMVIITNDDATKEDDDDDVPQDAEDENQRKKKRNLVLSLVNTTLVANQSVPLITALSVSNDDEPHVFTIWSYVYKGSVSYSGGREANRQIVTMNAGEHRLITLSNTIDVSAVSAASASYKVKVRKDDLKTPDEITKDLLILPKEGGSPVKDRTDGKDVKTPAQERISRSVREDILDVLSSPDGQQNRTIGGVRVPISSATAIFSSARSRASQLAMPIFFGVLGLCIIVIVWIEPRRDTPKRNI